MESNEPIYRKLQEVMNGMPVGYPVSESGADIRILKNLFTPEEARVAVELSMFPESTDRICRRVKDLGYTKEQAEHILHNMLMKGLVMGWRLPERKGGGWQYMRSQLAIGIFEYQANKLKKEIVSDLSEYIKNTFRDEFFKKGIPVQMRTIPIGKSIKKENITATYDDVREIISRAKDTIVINNCVCREMNDKNGKPCRISKERETCIYLGPSAKWAIETGQGRTVSKNEILSILDRFEEAGFVLQPENTCNPHFICCCCGCCCGVLTMVKQFPRPAEFYSSNYYAIVDTDNCKGDGTCMYRCRMGAITVKNGKSVVNSDRCIGCGLCTSTCKNDAIVLQRKDKIRIPPADIKALYRDILIKKIGYVRTAFLTLKYMLGFKV